MADRRYFQGHGVFFVGITFYGRQIEVAIAQFEEENDDRKSPLIMVSDRDEYFLVTLPDPPYPLRIDAGRYGFKGIPNPLQNS